MKTLCSKLYSTALGHGHAKTTVHYEIMVNWLPYHHHCTPQHLQCPPHAAWSAACTTPPRTHHSKTKQDTRQLVVSDPSRPSSSHSIHHYPPTLPPRTEPTGQGTALVPINTKSFWQHGLNPGIRGHLRQTGRVQD